MPVFRIGIGKFWHESNTFCPAKTPLSDFSSCNGIRIGNDILESESRDEMAGAVDVFRRNGQVDIVPLLSAEALPAGYITDHAVSYLEDILRGQLRKAGQLDGICFALHGAMCAESAVDLDGYFLQVLREELGSDIPIVCPLDCHAVVTQQMVDLTTALVAYRTHPHKDVVETGMLAASILLDVLAGKTRPVMHCQKIPMIFPTPNDGTDSGPLKELFDKLIDLDHVDGVIACSLCPAFAWQDVPEQGWAALAVTDNNKELGCRLARELAEMCWEARHMFMPEPMLSPESAVRQAAAAPGCPIVITDSADNVGGGAGGDNTVMLEALLKLRGETEGLILHHIPDAETVSILKVSKVGDTVTVRVGGKRDSRFCKPVSVTGEILCVTEGFISNDGKFTPKPLVEVGAIVCLGIDNVRLVITERLIMGPQPSLFRKVGLEPFDAKIVALKTGIGYKVTYAHAAKNVFAADCPGALSYNLRNYEFKRVLRPIFPIDPYFKWEPGMQKELNLKGEKQ
ncbi:MAG: M81 family metallopeptidase [bacterium]|nr:M81 family metallopeptidase [bacterium]